ncbi:hypothetical protein PPBDW_II1336 [Photobacterium kishitanii]|nr:hypothetical protein PPBDW_II1336 [Photobacterium kishitanii]
MLLWRYLDFAPTATPNIHKEPASYDYYKSPLNLCQNHHKTIFKYTVKSPSILHSRL